MYTCLIGDIVVDSILAYRHFHVAQHRRRGRPSTREVSQAKLVAQLVEELVGSGSRPGRTPLQEVTSYQYNTPGNNNNNGIEHVLRPIGNRTVQKRDSPLFGKQYRIRQKCAVCLRVHGRHVLTPYKCSTCSRHGKDFYVCADRCYTMHGKSETRNCFTWHTNNALPPKRARAQ